MRTGVNMETGAVLTGWAHCVQSIRTILTTRAGSRMWRRSFGASVIGLQDRNAHPRVLLELYRDVATALARDEPGFRLETIDLVTAGRDGAFRFDLAGTYFPRGHLGDFSILERKQTRTEGFLPGIVEIAS